MKKLALLLPAFLALPAAAWATPQESPSPVAEQFATAAAHCTSGNITPTSPKWGPCVNEYLQINYKYQLMPIATRWLAMVRVVSQFAPDMLILPVALPATSTSWNLPVRYQGTVYQEGNNWCATPWGVGVGPQACSATPEVAFVKYVMKTRRAPAQTEPARSGMR